MGVRMARLRFPLVALLFLTPLVACAGEKFRYPAKKLSEAAELKYIDGIPVLIVSGSPRAIGEQVGVLGARPARRLFDYPRDFMNAVGAGALWPVLLWRCENMLKSLPGDARQEMDAIVASSGLEREIVVAGNAMFDVKKMFLCSALGVDSAHSATGSPLLGRNLDFPPLGYLGEYSLVTIFRPTGKHAFVSVGFPGMVGCLSGMNDAGLALGVLEIFETKADEPRFEGSGVPYAICFRQLLEECSTIQEAEVRLRAMKRTTTVSLAMADRNGVAVLEITPAHVVCRQPKQGVSVCTNHFCSDALKPEKVKFMAADTKRRYARLEKASTQADKLGIDDLHHGLDSVNLGDCTLHTMVFEPSKLRLHLAITPGPGPASAGPLKTLNLASLFGVQSP
jgi:predicted choloylglycine hydrolase